MKAFARLIDAIAYYMQLVSGALLVAMMLIVLADVSTRAIFGMTGGSIDFTFIGGVELVKYALLFTVLFALPYCVDRSQVIVDLFTERMSERGKTVLEAIYLIGYAALGTGMSIRFYESIFNSINTGETTQDLLIPLSYIYVVTTFATTILALRSLSVAQRKFCNALGANA